MYSWHYDYKLFKLEYLASQKGLTKINFIRDFKKHDLSFDPKPFEAIHRFMLSYVKQNPIDVKIDLDYTSTEFQQRVYDEALSIPFGKTISYGELAERINNPKAARAVGGALGKNPFPILIPCHRIVGSTGKLTGFSAIDGIELKRKLIDFELEE